MSDQRVRRNIIKIDEEKCDGCGLCIPDCPEGALQIVDGKARLVGETLCDGLGACLGRCPQGAITVEEREAAAYDEPKVMARMAQQGPAAIQAHLNHLRDHNEAGLLAQALEFLRGQGKPAANGRVVPVPENHGGGCPGSRIMSFQPRPPAAPTSGGEGESQLGHWPIQMHLLNPLAPHYRDSHLLLAADCVPFALAGFHQTYLRGKTLAIACPKLDAGQDVYVEKLAALADRANISAITVMIMQVPCCQGLLRLAQEAAARSSRKIPIRVVVVGLQGSVLSEGPAKV